jgi:hypothetical protein
MIKKLFFLALLFFLPLVAWASFPTNSVLASFTCTNSTSQLCPNGNWSSITIGFGDTAGITSNSAYDVTNSNGFLDVWNPTTFSETMEVYVTLSTVASGGVPDGIGFISGTSGTVNGYLITASSSHIYVRKFTGSSLTNLTTFNVTVSNGDSIGATLASGGTITTYYKSGSGSWVSEGTTTDTTYSPTYLGLVNLDGDSTSRFTNFGGGNESSSPSSTKSGFNFGF